MPTDEWVVVCVLHGDPVIPEWLHKIADRLHLVVNDPAPGSYRDLPAAREVHVNDGPLGFATNVNAAIARTTAPVIVCVNFDLELDPGAFPTLIAALVPPVGLAGPLLTSPTGTPVLSVGGPPTSSKEFTRAAGLRSGGPQQLVRALLRRTGRWQQRNLDPRVLAVHEYIPWTCVALRRDAWEAVGPLDERFEMYAEDIDWGRRATEAGWRSALVDAGRVVHTERATRSARTDLLYEQSHASYHAKWGLDGPARWQRRGLAVRRLLQRGG